MGNVANALVTLFALSTFTGWSSVMYDAVEATAVYGEKIPKTRYMAPIVFIPFLIFGGFFMFNLFVGEVVFTFGKLKKDYDGSALLSEEQQEWVFAKRLIKTIKLHGKAPPPKEHWRM